MSIVVQDPVSIPVIEASQAGEARRAAISFAEALKFKEDRIGHGAIVVTELANNLVRHGKGGEIVLRTIRHGPAEGIEILAIDKGPGIHDVSQALRDGYSTVGTPGTGLGAARRLSTEFDIYSNAGSSGVVTGTVVMARLWNTEKPPVDELEVGVVSLPKPGEESCGDHWGMHKDGQRTRLIVADGLGHGLQAAEASMKAVRLLHENAIYDPVRLMETMHTALRSTRGAAVAIVDLSSMDRTLQFVGVGNISALLISSDGAMRYMTSHNGTIGAEARRIQSFPYEWPAGSTLILHSDGIATQWQMAKYPRLIHHPASVIAAVLYRDHRRIRDDATVLVVRQRRSA